MHLRVTQLLLTIMHIMSPTLALNGRLQGGASAHTPASRTPVNLHQGKAVASSRGVRLIASAHRQQLASRGGGNAADTASEDAQRRRGSGLGDLLGPIGLTIGGPAQVVSTALHRLQYDG